VLPLHNHSHNRDTRAGVVSLTALLEAAQSELIVNQAEIEAQANALFRQIDANILARRSSVSNLPREKTEKIASFHRRSKKTVRYDCVQKSSRPCENSAAYQAAGAKMTALRPFETPPVGYQAFDLNH
jgi:hypothetical protein